MRTALAALVLVAVVAGCNTRDADRDATDTARHSADTSLTDRTVQDTTIVTHDTVIRTDTVVKPGTVTDSAVRARARRP